MRYNYPLFDWDGCLSDTMGNAERIYSVLAGKNSQAYNKEMFKKAVGNWDKTAELLGYGKDIARLKADYSEEMNLSIARIEMNPGAVDLLRKINAKGLKVCVVTTSSREWVLQQMQTQAILDLLDEVIGIEDVKKPKPDPEPLEKMLKKLRVEDKSQAVMIGDTENDITAAAEAGIDSIWYSPKINQEIYGKQDMDGYTPTYKVEHLNEVWEIIN